MVTYPFTALARGVAMQMLCGAEWVKWQLQTDLGLSKTQSDSEFRWKHEEHVRNFLKVGPVRGSWFDGHKRPI
jgi:hypothetical protein